MRKPRPRTVGGAAFPEHRGAIEVDPPHREVEARHVPPAGDPAEGTRPLGRAVDELDVADGEQARVKGRGGADGARGHEDVVFADAVEGEALVADALDGAAARVAVDEDAHAVVRVQAFDAPPCHVKNALVGPHRADGAAEAAPAAAAAERRGAVRPTKEAVLDDDVRREDLDVGSGDVDGDVVDVHALATDFDACRVADDADALHHDVVGPDGHRSRGPAAGVERSAAGERKVRRRDDEERRGVVETARGEARAEREAQPAVRSSARDEPRGAVRAGGEVDGAASV
mmetsp:Transcript_31262/g.108063  ORF Transcript_31262/g.108063 Transcript_31262/m.108063 type:complete len:287 (+) Transcript_31262:1009-1869(+)